METTEEVSAFPPPGVEVHLIEGFVPLKGRRILEIGCGDGRLTFLYAARASTVVAIDPDSASLAEARRARAREGRVSHVAFRRSSAEQVPVRGDAFDVVLSLSRLRTYIDLLTPRPRFPAGGRQRLQALWGARPHGARIEVSESMIITALRRRRDASLGPEGSQ